jgi:hypothetical protein
LYLIAALALLYCAGSVVGNSTTRLGSDVSDESGCCGPQGLVCSGADFSGVVEQILYFAHPRSTGGSFDWGNHNMADSLGEAVSCVRAQLFAGRSASAVCYRSVRSLLYCQPKSFVQRPQSSDA